MSFYEIIMTDDSGESYVALGSGDIADVSYLAKSGLKRINGTDGEYIVKIEQGAFINDKDARTVLSLTADYETIEIVLSRKLAALRKSERSAGNEQDAGKAETAEESTSPQDVPEKPEEEELYPVTDGTSRSNY